MTLADGAVWNYQKSICMDSNAASNRLVVTRGATLNVNGNGDFYSGSGEVSGANRVEVSDGATLRASGHIYVTQRENTLVVSNATIASGKNLYVGNLMSGGTEESIMGNRLEICGTNPVVTAVSGFGIYRDSTLKFRLPAEGYLNDVPPVTANSSTIGSNVTLEIDGIAEMRRSRERKKTRIALIHTSTGVTVPSTTIDAVNASFVAAGAPDCRLYVSDDGKDLMLKVPLCKGLYFTIR